jgi:uncharacterized protein (TIGR02611 family)
MSDGSLVERLRAQRERHLERPRIVRLGFIVAGFILLAAGAAMLVLPGPAFVVIPIALAILSLEFAWAGRLLEKALMQAEKARQSASETTRAQRIAVIAAVVFAIAAFVAAAVLWDIPVLPI